MAANRITKKWLQNHFSYSWWKYVLVAVISAMGVNMLFTTTAYRPPEEKKIELFICNDYADAVSLQEKLEPLFFERFPGQEEFSVMNIDLTSEDMYANMQFSTYLAAQQGDVLLMPQSEVRKYASEGADAIFMELTPYVESGVIDVGDIDLSEGRLLSEAGEEGLYAIPADTLYGLVDYYNIPEGSMLCVTSYCGNEETSAAVLGMLMELFRTEKPAGYDDTVKGKQNQPSIFN